MTRFITRITMGDEGKGKIVDVLTSKYDIILVFRVDQMLDTL
jgi:adenylosuccinate synthase